MSIIKLQITHINKNDLLVTGLALRCGIKCSVKIQNPKFLFLPSAQNTTRKFKAYLLETPIALYINVSNYKIFRI